MSKVSISVNSHLSKSDIVKNGSIFTPQHIVDLVVEEVRGKLTDETTVVDFGAGYGAFCNSFLTLPHKRLIATDFDEKSAQFLRQEYSGLEVICENSILDIRREKYCEDGPLVVVGNPPYNDVTSQYKKGEKGSFEMDPEVYSRDLGISFLKMYDKIGADYVCVLHPLSYLCKKNNFQSLGDFSRHYRLVNGILFSSKHFESIKKTNAEFPVVAAFYVRNPEGMSFQAVLDFPFKVFGSSKTFCIGAFKTIDGVVPKYPTKDKKDEDLQFYTLRDINALRRNRSFLTGFCSNGIKVTKDNLHYYAWLDLFKTYFNAGENDYLFGNLSPLLTERIDDPSLQRELVAYALNENNFVRDYFKAHDPAFFNELSKAAYDKGALIRECSRLAGF